MADQRTPRSSSAKVPAALDLAQRAIGMFMPGDPDAGRESHTAEMAALNGGVGTGIEPPLPAWVEVSSTLVRYFAFVDVCGFTSFTDRHGPKAATEVLTRFRAAVRDVTARRGVRVLKWLGDGVMLVGVDAGPLVAAVVEIELRFAGESFEVHAGVAGGPVLIFEGDDYIGRPINLAARLCEAAAAGEILAVGVREQLPSWVTEHGRVTVRAAGIGDVRDVSRITAADSARALAAGEVEPPAATGGGTMGP